MMLGSSDSPGGQTSREDSNTLLAPHEHCNLSFGASSPLVVSGRISPYRLPLYAEFVIWSNSIPRNADCVPGPCAALGDKRTLAQPHNFCILGCGFPATLRAQAGRLLRFAYQRRRAITAAVRRPLVVMVPGKFASDAAPAGSHPQAVNSMP